MHCLRGAAFWPGLRVVKGLSWLVGASAALVLGSFFVWNALPSAGPPECRDAAIMDEMGVLSRILMEKSITANAAYHDPERIDLVYPQGQFRVDISVVQEMISSRSARLCRAIIELRTPQGFNAARPVEYNVIKSDDGARSFAWLRAQDDIEELNRAIMGPFCRAEALR